MSIDLWIRYFCWLMVLSATLYSTKKYHQLSDTGVIIVKTVRTVRHTPRRYWLQCCMVIKIDLVYFFNVIPELATSDIKLHIFKILNVISMSTKVCFYKLFANSATRWDFLWSKIISKIAKSYQIFNFSLF